jgi:putative FmdB family regulatory protein
VCEHRFEKIQKFTDPPPDACPKCSGAVRKLFSSPAIQFKGTGWYITDYAKKSASDGGQQGSSEKSGSTDKAGAPDKDKKDKGDAGSGKSDSASSKTDSGSSGKSSASSGKSDSGSSSSGDSAPAAPTKKD